MLLINEQSLTKRTHRMTKLIANSTGVFLIQESRSINKLIYKKHNCINFQNIKNSNYPVYVSYVILSGTYTEFLK